MIHPLIITTHPATRHLRMALSPALVGGGRLLRIFLSSAFSASRMILRDRPKQADSFLPPAPARGRPADVRDLSSFCHPDRSGEIVAGQNHGHGRWNHLPTAPPLACHPEPIRRGCVIHDSDSCRKGPQLSHGRPTRAFRHVDHPTARFLQLELHRHLSGTLTPLPSLQGEKSKRTRLPCL